MNYFCEEEDCELGKRPSFQYIMQKSPVREPDRGGDSQEETGWALPGPIRNAKRVRQSPSLSFFKRTDQVLGLKQGTREFQEQYRLKCLAELRRYKDRVNEII